jgi:hypothetical protein
MDAPLLDDVREDATDEASDVAIAVVTTVVNIRVLTLEPDNQPLNPVLSAGERALLVEPVPDVPPAPPPPPAQRRSQHVCVRLVVHANLSIMRHFMWSMSSCV